MKIVFDARVIETRMHGIARYGLNLLQRLLSTDQGHEYLILGGPSFQKERFSPVVHTRWLRTGVPLYSLQEQVLIPWLIRAETFDLFHSPTFTLPLALASKGILTIHDLIPMVFPKDFGLGHRFFFRLVVRRAVSKCRIVFTVSEYSRQDIRDRLHVDQKRIIITPNGLDDLWGPKPQDPDFAQQYGLDQGYILFIGNPKPHKNFHRVLEAFKLLVTENHYSGKLLVIGLPPRMLPPEIKDRVQFITYSEDESLNRFYSGASLLAAPSLYEGFGLPVLEAMACGCPVLTSDRGALLEIAGEAGYPVDPYDIRAIKEGMVKILLDPNLSSQLKDRGKRRVGDFSWETTARVVLKTYKSLDGKT